MEKNRIDSEYDVIIIGTGAGGGTLAYSLSKSGKKILVLERGAYLPREKQNWEVSEVFLKNRYKTKDVWFDSTGEELHPGTHYFVGGNTKVYGAALLRFRERDFDEVEHKGGTSPAWPLKYRDFQPYYVQAENLFHVHGTRGVDPTDPPETTPFPFKAISNEPYIQELYEGMQKKGYRPFPLPLGLMLNEENREESRCIRCDTCDGFPCLVDAKADTEINCIKPALNSGCVTLLTDAKAIRIETDQTGKRAVQVVVERLGNLESYRASTFVVACGAVNSAALLLRSKNDKHLQGLANSSGQVGRNYMHHINSAMLAFSKARNPTNYQKTFGLNDFYHNAPDWPYPLGHIQLLGNVKSDMLKGAAPKLTPNLIFATMSHHAVGWWLSSEDLPDPENRVTLNSSGNIVLSYKPNNEEGHERLVKKLKGILRAVDSQYIAGLSKRIPIEGVAHQVGTCRFGTDPATSVLDVHCKTHDVDNLYVVDGSFFPSSAAVNPALTIMANALRVGEHLKTL